MADYNSRIVCHVWFILFAGTETMLLSKREQDDSSLGFTNWPFMSVHTWGENPRGAGQTSGKWKVIIMDAVSK